MSDGEQTEGARERRLAERMRWRATGDAELVAAMRRGNYEALREFYARFEPLLARYASRAGLSGHDWEEDAHDVLSDVVLALIENARPGRAGAEVRDIHGYIQRAFRNRMLDARRTAARREQRDVGATTSDAASGERIVRASWSEGSLRASDADASTVAESTATSPAVARLAAVLSSELSGSERQMLTWVSNSVPMREIAQWLEISYAAAKVRLSRTRSRMRQRALRHVSECTGREREELADFFRRSAGRGRPVDAASPECVAAEPGGAHGDV